VDDRDERSEDELESDELELVDEDEDELDSDDVETGRLRFRVTGKLLLDDSPGGVRLMLL
jgi:hypothetical protein